VKISSSITAITASTTIFLLRRCPVHIPFRRAAVPLIQFFTCTQTKMARSVTRWSGVTTVEIAMIGQRHKTQTLFRNRQWWDQSTTRASLLRSAIQVTMHTLWLSNHIPPQPHWAALGRTNFLLLVTQPLLLPLLQVHRLQRAQQVARLREQQLLPQR